MSTTWIPNSDWNPEHKEVPEISFFATCPNCNSNVYMIPEIPEKNDPVQMCYECGWMHTL